MSLVHKVQSFFNGFVSFFTGFTYNLAHGETREVENKANTTQKTSNFQSLSFLSVFLFHFEFLLNTNHFSDL